MRELKCSKCGERNQAPKEMKHTALPWEMEKGIDGAVIYEPGAGTIANIPIDLSNWNNNADFIFQACDCHKELVEACKLALQCVGFRHIRDIIEDALDKATK